MKNSINPLNLTVSIFVIVISVAILSLEVTKGRDPKKQTTTVDKDELAWIFEIGYLKGIVNEVECDSYQESKLRWQKDSAEIIGIYFKKETK